MISKGPLLAQIGAALGSRAVVSPNDGAIGISPIYSPSAPIPEAILIPTVQVVGDARSSFLTNIRTDWTSNNNTIFAVLVEGVWDIFFTHHGVFLGAGNSSAFTDFRLRQTIGGVVRQHSISRFNASSNSYPHTGRFLLTVPVASPVEMIMDVIGFAGNQFQYDLVVVANRLL